MDGPENAAAPGGGSEGKRENDQLRADVAILPFDSEAAKRRCALLEDAERRNASRALDMLLGIGDRRWNPSERWERALCNQLAADGFDPEYLARRYGLRMRGAA